MMKIYVAVQLLYTHCLTRSLVELLVMSPPVPSSLTAPLKLRYLEHRRDSQQKVHNMPIKRPELLRQYRSARVRLKGSFTNYDD